MDNRQYVILLRLSFFIVYKKCLREKIECKLLLLYDNNLEIYIYILLTNERR